MISEKSINSNQSLISVPIQPIYLGPCSSSASASDFMAKYIMISSANRRTVDVFVRGLYVEQEQTWSQNGSLRNFRNYRYVGGLVFILHLHLHRPTITCLLYRAGVFNILKLARIAKKKLIWVYRIHQNTNGFSRMRDTRTYTQTALR